MLQLQPTVSLSLVGNGQPEPRSPDDRDLNDLRHALLLIDREINTSSVPKDFAETELLSEVKRFLTDPHDWEHLNTLRPVLGLFTGPNGQTLSTPQEAAALREAVIAVAPPGQEADKWKILLSLEPRTMAARLRKAKQPLSDQHKRKLAAELAGLIALVIEDETNTRAAVNAPLDPAHEPATEVIIGDPSPLGDTTEPDRIPSLDPPPATTERRPQTVVIAAAVGAALVAVIIVFGWIATSSNDDQDGQGTGPTTSTTAPTTSSSTASSSTTTMTSVGPADGVTLTFDDLIGGEGIIRVFPGYTSSRSDTEFNGTYAGGQDATAVCVASGRTVNSRPEDGEPSVSSDKWIRIKGSPGATQYASAVYVKDRQALIDALPPCT